ncbi:MAG: secretin N-terminal domain-containing protein [Erythrobacter sp.]
MAATLVAGLAMITLAFPAPALAGEPPFTDKKISLSARGQDVRDFVADLMGEAGLPVKVSTGVKGRVQGVFPGTAKEIWGAISRAYGLVAYYDGSVVRVYSQEELGSRSVSTYAPDQLVAQIRKLDIGDSVNTAKAGEGLVLITGVPAYLDRVEALASRMQSQLASAEPAVTPAVRTPSQLPMASPLIRTSVSSKVLRPAGGRNPFEVRIFYLKYRDAADREVRSTTRAEIIPGVASLLQEQMGDGRQIGDVTTSGTNIRQADGIRRLGPETAYDPLSGLSRAEPQGGTEPADYDLNGPRISADRTVNAVIVRDRPEIMPVYEALIANLDIEPLIVETQVTILELDVNRLKELSASLGGVIADLGLGALVGSPSLGAGGITGGFVTNDGSFFLGRLRLLEERGAVRVVTRPTLSTTNNEVATFDITAEQVIRNQSERVANAFAINYGLAMRIRPSAIEDGGDMRIRMQVEISDTSLNGMVVDGVPTAAGPRLTTTAIVRHGESAMLAGLARTRTFDRKRKTPGLGDIPLLGEVFKSRRKGEERIERLILLTPRVRNLQSVNMARQRINPHKLDQLSATQMAERQRAQSGLQ